MQCICATGAPGPLIFVPEGSRDVGIALQASLDFLWMQVRLVILRNSLLAGKIKIIHVIC